MKIERFIPSAPLQPFVKEIMILESELGMDSKVIPDTTMVMSFRYKGALLRQEGESKDAVPAVVTSGLRKSARIFCYGKDTANLLVVFKEGGFAAFFPVPSHELYDLIISSDNLLPGNELNEILERLAEAKSNNDRKSIIDTFLCSKLASSKNDLLVNNAIQVIRHYNGVVKIKDLAAALHISQDPLEKRFRALVGASPKQYASIVRLKNVISKYPSFASLTEASCEAGYFDQSHFIKDFRLFTGQTPKDFFKSSRYW